MLPKKCAANESLILLFFLPIKLPFLVNLFQANTLTINNLESKTSNPKPKTRNQKLETRNPKLETRNPKPSPIHKTLKARYFFTAYDHLFDGGGRKFQEEPSIEIGVDLNNAVDTYQEVAINPEILSRIELFR